MKWRRELKTGLKGVAFVVDRLKVTPCCMLSMVFIPQQFQTAIKLKNSWRFPWFSTSVFERTEVHHKYKQE